VAIPPLILRERLGPVADAVDAATTHLHDLDALARLGARDHTLWQDDPTEVADRLGWLPVVEEMQHRIGGMQTVAEAARADGFRHAVLLGMGGSSLFPEVLSRTFGAAPGHLELHVLDTTDPAPIRRIGELDLDQCLFVVASKSGSTIETRTQFEHFWEATGGSGDQFLVVTDPGSELIDLGDERKVRGCFENRADIGGRYSALSYFGLVPGALLGVDLAGLLQRAANVDHGAGLRLGAVMAGAARVGRDKLTLVLPEELSSFGLWLEQLIAESTGKHGVGVIPIADEPIGAPDVYGDDRLFVGIGAHPELDVLAAAGHPVVELAYDDRLDLGAQVLLWELATAFAGAVLGINPFDQPDVASAKAATNEVLEAGMPDIPTVTPASLLAQVRPGDYVALQLFGDPGDPEMHLMHEARRVLRDRYRVATTFGIGPRFLHSTGQLHKGGPPTGVFLQMVGPDHADLPIPGRDFTFSTLKQAQAAGDLVALQDRGLRAGRVSIHELLEETQ
jgi:transaldolase/glucose-6-phosphate isomerase